MVFVHLENVICRCQKHIITICENYRLKNIYKLSYICHSYTVSMFIENIESKTCNHSISHCVLLIKESGVCSFFNIKPCSPFINDKVNSVVRVIFIHNFKMTSDDFIHLVCFCYSYEIFFFAEFCSFAFLFP